MKTKNNKATESNIQELMDKIFDDHYDFAPDKKSKNIHYSLDLYYYDKIWNAKIMNVYSVDSTMEWVLRDENLVVLLNKVWHFLDALKHTRVNQEALRHRREIEAINKELEGAAVNN